MDLPATLRASLALSPRRFRPSLRLALLLGASLWVKGPLLPRTRRLTAPRLVAALVLAAASLFASGATASAADFGAQITFGHGPHRFSGGNWGGYVSTGGFTKASASWVMPDAQCSTSSDLFAPWVGLDGDGSATVEQTGVAVDCSNGTPAYKPWIEMYPAAPEYFNDPAAAGDQVSATVVYQGNGAYALTLSDATQGWSRTFSRTATAKNLTAEAIIESPTDSYPTFSDMRFTDVVFGEKALGKTQPMALSADDRGTGTWTPTPIEDDGRSFSFTRS